MNTAAALPLNIDSIKNLAAVLWLSRHLEAQTIATSGES